MLLAANCGLIVNDWMALSLSAQPHPLLCHISHTFSQENVVQAESVEKKKKKKNIENAICVVEEGR